jgi:hypothetical protein
VVRHKPLKPVVAEVNASAAEKPPRTKPRDLIPKAEPTATAITPPDEQAACPPDTPATTDIFSPTSEPSTARPAGRDTPPPAGFASLSATAASPNAAAAAAAGGRGGGRRARAPVNYAEPSLVAKMRRPTKQLLDAVGRDGRPLRGAIVGGRREVAGEWRPVGGAASAVAAEEDAGPGAEEEPPSPLRGKGVVAEEEEVVVAAARSAGSRRAVAPVVVVKPLLVKAKAAAARVPVVPLRDEDLAIFDFTESSPSSEARVEAPRAAAAGRRRCTMSEDQEGAVPARGARSSKGARRRSMMV